MQNLSGFSILQPNGHPCHKHIHHNEMTDTPAHHEQMENLMRAKILMSGVKQRQLQRVNNTAHRVNDAARQQPAKSRRRQGIQNLRKRQYAYPAHGDIQHRGKPFRAGNPEQLQDNARDGDAPYDGAEGISHLAAQHNQAHRRVGACDEHKNHAVIDFPQDAVRPLGQIQRVISGAGRVQQNHADDKNT